jgi:hypothetical protein
MLTRFDDEPDAAGVDVGDIDIVVRQYMRTVADGCGFIFPPPSDNQVTCLFYIKDLDTVVRLYGDLGHYFEENIKFADTFLFYDYANVTRDDTVSQPPLLEVFIGACDYNVYEVLRVLKALVENSPTDYVWVAMSPELSDSVLVTIAQYLLSNAFNTPKLSSTTIAGLVLQKPAITFILDKVNISMHTETIPEALKYVASLKERALPSNLDTCTYTVYVPPETLLKAREEFLDKDREYAGTFVITGYSVVEDRRRKPAVVAKLGMPVKDVVRGEATSVVPPQGLFNFHTHPIITYTLNSLALNTPSASDLLGVTYYRLSDTVMHLLIAVEGMYTIQMTPEFQQYMDYMEKFDQTNLHACRTPLLLHLKALVKTFEQYAGGTQSHRGTISYHGGGEKDMDKFLYGGLDNLTERDHELIDEYLSSANNISINDVIDNNVSSRCAWLDPGANFRLYMVAFTPWYTIARSGLTVDVTTVARGKLQCPPQITRELAKFEDTVLI